MLENIVFSLRLFSHSVATWASLAVLRRKCEGLSRSGGEVRNATIGLQKRSRSAMLDSRDGGVIYQPRPERVLLLRDSGRGLFERLKKLLNDEVKFSFRKNLQNSLPEALLLRSLLRLSLLM